MRAVDSKQYLSPEGSLEGGYEYKTESQVLLERRKEHENRQAVKHKKDFIQYMSSILTRPAAVKETSSEPVNIRSILPLDQQEERDPTSKEVGDHVLEQIWNAKKEAK